MFRFESPEYLYLLILIPVFVLLFLYGRIQRRRKLKRLGEKNLILSLMPDVSTWRPIAKFILAMLALTFLIIMQARPQMGMKIETNAHQGIEMMVCLDVSNSMLASDVSPNRLDKAKMLVSNITDKLTNDKIGLIVFAGESFIQMPLTSDNVSARMFLDAISPNMVSTQGTNISSALTMAENSFTNQKNVERAIVVITDGEDHEGGAVDVATEAAKKGMHVYVLGIGDPKGSPISINGKDYLRDRQGMVVITKLNTDNCKQISAAGKGMYIHVDNSNIAQDRLYYELNKLSKKDLGSTVYSDYDEQFQIFAIMALLMLIIEIAIFERKNAFLRQFKMFRNNEK